MGKVAQFSMPGHEGGHPAEDALFVNPVGTLLAVADGVTRSVEDGGAYPNPSPARSAADILCQTAKTFQGDMEHIEQLFAEANEGILALNTKLGFAGQTDYFTRDLAGTVAAVVVRNGQKIAYGFIGDCGVAVLNNEAEIMFQTPDEVAPVAAQIPKHPELSAKDRQIMIRRDYRNKPQAPYPTYGVLTGEPEALAYVRTGVLTLRPGDVLVVYSDGAAPVLASIEARRLLAASLDSDLQDFIRARRQDGAMRSELTLTAVRA